MKSSAIFLCAVLCVPLPCKTLPLALDLQLEEHSFLSTRQSYTTAWIQVSSLLESDRLDNDFKTVLKQVLTQYFPKTLPSNTSPNNKRYVELLATQIKEFYTLTQFARLQEIEKFNQVCARMLEVLPELEALGKEFKNQVAANPLEHTHSVANSSLHAPDISHTHDAPEVSQLMTPESAPSETNSKDQEADTF